jgi:hypothetical protein
MKNSVRFSDWCNSFFFFLFLTSIDLRETECLGNAMFSNPSRRSAVINQHEDTGANIPGVLVSPFDLLYCF